MTILEEYHEFPSPFGVHVLKLASAAREKVLQEWTFPSPFGVHVLKFRVGQQGL